MASPRVKNTYQEGALIGARILAFVAVVLTVGLAAWLTAAVAGAPFGLAGAIGGATGGLAGFVMLFCGSIYELKSFTCPSCGQKDNTLRHIGYYNCAGCNTKFYIQDKEVTNLGA